MSARYLIRLDDACHSMDRRKWGEIEALLDAFDIKPIVAVVPDNRDPELNIDPYDPLFWNRVRAWQAKGWTIAMHGYQHVMHPTESKLVLPFYKRSEFGGLPYARQAEKIRLSWDMFLSEGITPTAWIAPAHSFDWTTVEAILSETNIRIISDGLARNVYYERECYWIPQQLWAFKKARLGMWTVCLHPNTMTEQNLSDLSKSIQNEFLTRIVSLGQINLTQRRKSAADHLYGQYFLKRGRVISALTQVRVWLRG